MDILIGGDLVPTQTNMDLFANAEVNTLLGEELLSIWNSAVFRIFNLEVPITDTEDPIKKCGSNLIAPVRTFNGIKALNPSLVALANNHILDQGSQGLKSTEKLLYEHEISYVGIGDNLSIASKPFVFTKDGITIGVYACTEHEFSIATENSPGANPFDPLQSLDHIALLKAECDYVIILYHGGKEHYRYPSPDLQKICRRMAQKGADLIVCQHSHCIGCHEIFEGSTIVYGQGNFIFDYSESEFWKTSVLIRVNITDSIQVEYIPFIKCENNIRIAGEEQKTEILKAFHERSLQILQQAFVEKTYTDFAKDMLNGYLYGMLGNSFGIKVLRKIFGHRSLRFLYSAKALLRIQNYIECEAHRELLLEGMKVAVLKNG